jgi:DNA-binding NarL/FixJ family response regulator
MNLNDLSGRRREIAELLATGLSRAEIAGRLGTERGRSLSVRTVDAHVRLIAAALPPDDLTAFRRVKRWAQTQRRAAG